MLKGVIDAQGLVGTTKVHIQIQHSKMISIPGVAQAWLLLTPLQKKTLGGFSGNCNLISTKKLKPKDPLPNSSQATNKKDPTTDTAVASLFLPECSKPQ